MPQRRVTTSTELVGAPLIQPDQIPVWQATVNDAAFPARMVLYNMPAMPGTTADYDAIAEAAAKLREIETDNRLRAPGIKLVADGSIQGWTAVVMEPGYFTGEDHGLLLFSPGGSRRRGQGVPRPQAERALPLQRQRQRRDLHRRDRGRLRADAWLDHHRHVVQHSQMTTAAQYRRMGRMGICANIFTNHIWYWGDQHYEQTMGPGTHPRNVGLPHRAGEQTMPLSFHTDSGVTPIATVTMWRGQPVDAQRPRPRRVREASRPTKLSTPATIGGAFQLH